MKTETDKHFEEVGRKAYHMGIDLSNIPTINDRDKKSVEIGFNYAKVGWERRNRKPGREGTMRRVT